MPLDFGQAVPVKSVSDEHVYMAAHPCLACGGRWRVRLQALLQDAHGRHYDQVDAVCRQCGARQTFLFDIGAVFSGRQS
jgi:hypothetical protein